MNQNGEVLQIPIEDLIPNRFQPRITFDEKALNELANSIKQHGIIQPLVVRRLQDKYEIIAGERRYKAAQIAGLISVPALVTDANDEASAEIALVENVQRRDLSSIEEAKSYRNILDKSDMTQEDLAKKMGLSQSSVANKLRLLNLNEDVQQALMDGKISERHARSLLTVDDANIQSQLLARIIDERLTVKQLDEEIKNIRKHVSDDIIDDVPLVDIDGDLEKMKQQATDIVSPMSSGPRIQNNDGYSNIDSDGKKFFTYGDAQESNDKSSVENMADVSIEKSPENAIFESGTSEVIEAPVEIVPEDNNPNSSDVLVEEVLNTNLNQSNEIETLDVVPNVAIFEQNSKEEETIDLPAIINEVRSLINKLNVNNNIKISEIDTVSSYKIEIEIEKDS